MFSGFHALYLYAFKHTFLVLDQVTHLLQVPVYIQFFPSAILSPDGSGHSLNSNSLRSVLFSQPAVCTLLAGAPEGPMTMLKGSDRLGPLIGLNL